MVEVGLVSSLFLGFWLVRSFLWFVCSKFFLVALVGCDCGFSLRKHAYSNIQKFSPPKTEKIQIKTLIFDTYLLKT